MMMLSRGLLEPYKGRRAGLAEGITRRFGHRVGGLRFRQSALRASFPLTTLFLSLRGNEATRIHRGTCQRSDVADDRSYADPAAALRRILTFGNEPAGGQATTIAAEGPISTTTFP